MILKELIFSILTAEPFRAEKTGCPLCLWCLTLELEATVDALAKHIEGCLLSTCNLLQ